MNDRNGALAGTVNVLKNVTADKRMQAQLIHSEKLAATGKLATSLAHEINNPLQGIQGCLELAEESVADGERRRSYLMMAKSEVARLSTVVQRILDLYRPVKPAGTPVDLRAVIDDVLGLCGKRMRAAAITVRIEWDDTWPAIKTVDQQIRQVFLNLVLNAIEAMPRGGELTVSGRRVEQAWLTIALADTGVGMAAETLESIFEPF